MPLSRDEFLRRVTDSGLLTGDIVTDRLANLSLDGQPRDGEQMAREMVRLKILTKFQAEQIYSGKGHSLVLGNYVILNKLGQGGMGMVLKAEHRRLKRLVAIKVMSPAALKTPDALKRFHREVEAAAKLRHTNVVATDDADEAKGTHFLVMEYIDGSDLSALVKGKGPLSVEQAVRCIVQAARGLEFAHQQGVVHRDIKPANLLLDARGTVKILDMGLARIEGEAGAHSELTSTGAVMGTVDYMAPEQALNTKSADARSDVYSLGISLWYLLTEKCAYDGDTMMAKLLAHRDSPIPSLHQIRSEVPESVDAVFQKMVAKKAQDRYQTMTEVIADLEGILEGTGSESGLRVPISRGDSLSVGPPTSGLSASSSKMSRSSPSVMPSPSPQEATYVSSSDSATEATMLSGDLTQATDPQTPTSARSLLRKKNGTGARTGRDSAATPDWRQDRRVQIGGGIGALLLVLAAIFLSSGKKNVPNKTSEIVKNDSTTTSGTDKGSPSPNATTVGATKAPPPAIAPFDGHQARAHQEAWAKHLGVPAEYTNNIGMKFVLIPPGEFMMGSTQAEIEGALPDAVGGEEVHRHWQESIRSESPQHKVVLTQPIFLGVNEVTQKEYEMVLGSNPSNFSAMGGKNEVVSGMDTARHPVERVSWNDAAEFCTKLSQQESLRPFYSRAEETISSLHGTGYRLPTEAEWEFACRAGTTTKYWIGDKDEDLMHAGWFGTNSGHRTHVVGELKANPLGLYDIHGNVWEWVEDWWEPTYYKQVADKPAINPINSSTGSLRIVRGGVWHHPASCGRASFRYSQKPTDRYDHIGFRVALPVDETK